MSSYNAYTSAPLHLHTLGPSHHTRAEQVMDIQRADERPVLVDDEQLSDARGFE
jgi:hypothetical protein